MGKSQRRSDFGSHRFEIDGNRLHRREQRPARRPPSQRPAEKALGSLLRITGAMLIRVCAPPLPALRRRPRSRDRVLVNFHPCFELGAAPLYLLDGNSQVRLRSSSIRRRERRRPGPVSASGLQRIPDLVKTLREKIEGHLAV